MSASSTRSALNTRFTVVTPHPTVRGKYMVVTSERPCAGCSRSSSMCAYILSPLGDQIFKASKCTHCAATSTRCGQAGAIYRFDKDMREGHLIDPNTTSESEEYTHSEEPTSSASSADSGNEASSEEGGVTAPPNAANTSADASTARTVERGSGAGSSSRQDHHERRAQEMQERVRRNTTPSPSPGRHQQPAPLQLDKAKSPGDNSLLNPESPGKSVRFALPPSPPLSNTSPIAPTGNHHSRSGHGHSHVGSFGHDTLVEENEQEDSHDRPASPVSNSASQIPLPTSPSPPPRGISTPPPEDPKLRGILNKLATLEVRLGCLEGINSELRKENRHLQRKNANLRYTMGIIRSSHRTSADALARALKLVDDVEKDRRRLVEEIK